AAFQSLGQFISTFASPSSNVGQYFRDEGEWSGSQTHSSETDNERSLARSRLFHRFSTNADAAPETPAVCPQQEHDSHDPSACEEQDAADVAEEGGGEQTAEVLSADESCCGAADSQKCLPEETPPSPEPGEEQDPPAAAQNIPEQELFNSFHYWRTPIPQIDLDLELLEEKKRPATPALGRKQLEELIENLEPHIDDPDVKGERSRHAEFRRL
ncbi:hypothetical protein M9458_047256, partial [Cirrhinus mrigala]